jgi:hypothetical protein
MKKKMIINLLIIGLSALITGVILHTKVLPLYIAGQAESEAKVAKIADEIRSGELVLSADKVANLLVAVADRSPEVYIVTFYVRVAIVAVSISLFIYLFGFFVGLKAGHRDRC